MGVKKRHPVYILLTVSEQIALANALSSFSFSVGGGRRTNNSALGLGRSLTELMVQIGSVHKPLLGPHNPMSGMLGPDALMASLLLIPMSECLRRVDSVMDRLDAEVSKYQRVFDGIYSQLERMTSTMGNIVAVLERIEQDRTEEANRAREGTRGVRCECGRIVSVEQGEEDGQEEREKEKTGDSG